MHDRKRQIISYILNQTAIDLEPYRTDFTKQWERPDEIIVEYRAIPRNLWRRIELLAAKKSGRICIEHVGVWGKMIAFKE